MSAWDYPVIIVATVVVGMLVFAGLMKLAAPVRPGGFECLVCGRKQRGILAREWRFCPYCGTPHRPTPRIPGVDL